MTAYLIAITPDLQKSRRQRRDEEMARAESMKQAEMAMAAVPPATMAIALPATVPMIDLKKAKMTYEETCSQCHELSDVDGAPPTSPDDSTAIIRRMITENDAELSKDQIEECRAYLVAHFVDKKI